MKENPKAKATKTRSVIQNFMKKRRMPKFDSVMFASEPSMNVSYRFLEKFPDPYGEFTPMDFNFYNFDARLKRYSLTKKAIIADPILNVRPKRARITEEMFVGPFNFTPETQVSEVLKKFQHMIKTHINIPNNPYHGIMRWIQLQHIPTKELLTFHFEDTVDPPRFVCTIWEVPGKLKETVNNKNLPHIKELTCNLAIMCHIQTSTTVTERIICAT